MKHALPGGRAMLAALIALTLAACAAPARLLAPDLRGDVPLAGLQAPERAGWPAAQWWRQYHDPQLDNLMESATRQSPDLAMAQSRVAQAGQAGRLGAAQLGELLGLFHPEERRKVLVAHHHLLTLHWRKVS